MTDNIRLLNTVSKKQIRLSIQNLEWFMRYFYLHDDPYTYTIGEGGKYIVVHEPESGDMCIVLDHPRILEKMQEYGIEAK